MRGLLSPPLFLGPICRIVLLFGHGELITSEEGPRMPPIESNDLWSRLTADAQGDIVSYSVLTHSRCDEFMRTGSHLQKICAWSMGASLVASGSQVRPVRYAGVDGVSTGCTSRAFQSNSSMWEA